MNTNEQKYLYNLAKQFISATGAQNIDFNSTQFKKELSDWITLNYYYHKTYYDFIENLVDARPSLDEDTTVEAGKGRYDSITIKKDLITISPYFEDRKNNINGKLSIIQSNPVIFTNGKYKVINVNEIRRFITHNPYSMDEIANWEDLHNSKVFNITIGIFGNIADKDKDTKIRELKEFKEKLLGYDYVEEHTTIQDNYYYAIASDRMVLERTLRR